MVLFEKTLTKETETGCKAIIHTDKNKSCFPQIRYAKFMSLAPFLHGSSSSGEGPGNENKG